MAALGCKSNEIALDANNKKVKEYKDKLKADAEDLVLKRIPETILNLNLIIDAPSFRNDDLSGLRQELNIPVPETVTLNSHDSDLPPAKRLRSENNSSSSSHSAMEAAKANHHIHGPVHSNKKLIEFIEFFKPHVRKLVEDSSLMKMWITLLIPKIEDGNNFGVSIQEETLAEIQSGETECAAYLERIATYYISRAKLVSKVAKYPHIEDYRRAVEEYDEMQYRNLRLSFIDMRNRYCTLHDIIVKNLEKIRIPRSTNATESLY